MKQIYIGQEARNKHMETIASFDKEKCIYSNNYGTAGYWYDYDNDVWVAYDNEDGNCWVEEFITEAAAKAWAECQDECLWIKEKIS